MGYLKIRRISDNKIPTKVVSQTHHGVGNPIEWVEQSEDDLTLQGCMLDAAYELGLKDQTDAYEAELKEIKKSFDKK